jgi:glycosyltransferase involved in cell wall biosynthesis
MLGARRPLQVVSRRVDFAVGGNALSRMKYRRGADVYLAISSGVRDALVAGGIPSSRIRLVPSGIDLGKFDGVGDNAYLDAEFAITPGTKVVGNIAALAPHKSQSDLLRAARIVCDRRRDVRFFIVGEGKQESELKSLASALDLGDRVVFTGFRRDVLELLSRFDLFVMSSYLEGLGTSIIDAQAAGIPVVATSTGGIIDIVHEGETGLLVPPRDPVALATAMMRMLDDKALRDKCVTAAREQSKGYDYRSTVYKTIAAYNELLGAPVVSPPVKGTHR